METDGAKITRWALPTPEPYQGPSRCGGCGGGRLAAVRSHAFGEPAPDGRVTLVDVFCPQCRGCGRAEHEGCDPREHADWERDWEPDWDDEDAEDAEPVCVSCRGRGWWVAQGFPPAGDTVLDLRVPCGCSAPAMVQVI